MKKEVMRAYAQIIVRLGVNVQPGQYVAITVSTAQDEIGVMVAQECYKAGAAHVRFNWTNDDFMRLRYINESIETMSEFTEELKGKYEDELKHPYVGIYIDDSDPDVFNGIDNEKLTEPRRRLYPFIKKYRDELEGKAQWTIVAMPQVSWARKMYPGVSDEEAMEKLEKAIMHTMRMDTEDPVGEWHKHIETLKAKAATMNEHHFKTLHYTAGNGTDFTVDLHPKHVWQTAWEKQRNGISSCVNMPTEEVFTIPEVHSAHGKLVASLPLSYNGNLIEDFSFEFEGGKIVKVDAAKGQEQLEKMIKMDENACMLGEVALVPFDSPINQIGDLFYNTLFDENAVCHIAVGAGFGDCMEGYEELTQEQIYAEGVNDSMIHVDFMVGTADLHITGIKENGEEVTVFDNGLWAI